MKDDTQPPAPDDLPDDVRDRMPDPAQPALGIKPDEAMRFLGGIAEANGLAAIIVATACHALEKHADDDPEERADHMKAIAKMLGLAGKLVCKAGADADTARAGMRKAFGAIGVQLDKTRHDPEAVAERIDGGGALHDAVKTMLDTKNGLAAGIICRTDHQGARDLADRAGVDPDEMKDRPLSIDLKTGKAKPVKDKTPDAPKPAKPTPTPPTWTGRNGSKWKPDGSRDDSTPNN